MKIRKIGPAAAACCLLLSGCRIQMTAQERAGINSNDQGSTATKTEEPAESLSVLTVELQKYNIYDVARAAYGMDKEEADAVLAAENMLVLTPENPDYVYGNTFTTVFTNGYGLDVQWRDFSGYYQSMWNNAKIYGRMDKMRPALRVDAVPSEIESAFPMSDAMKKTLEECAAEVAQELEKFGMKPDTWYGAMSDADFWSWYYKNGGYRFEGYEPEEETCFFSFRQSYHGVTVESIGSENRIFVAYDPKEHSMMYMTSYSPLFGETLSETVAKQIPKADALMLAKDILIRKYKLKNPVLSDAELVYTSLVFGGIDEEKQTITLYPTWKVGFETKVGGRTVVDYLYLDAENGLEKSDGDTTPISGISPDLRGGEKDEQRAVSFDGSETMSRFQTVYTGCGSDRGRLHVGILG